MEHIPGSKAASKSHDSYGGYFSPPLSQFRPSTENPQRKLHRHNFVAVPTPVGDGRQTAWIITGMDSIRDGTLTGSYPATTILRRASTLPHDQCQFGMNVSSKATLVIFWDWNEDRNVCAAVHWETVNGIQGLKDFLKEKWKTIFALITHKVSTFNNNNGFWSIKVMTYLISSI